MVTPDSTAGFPARRPWAAYRATDTDLQKWWRDRFDRLANDAADCLPECVERTRLAGMIEKMCELAVAAAGKS